MAWREWVGFKLTEAEFAQNLLREHPDAASWVHDPKARTLSHAGNVMSLDEQNSSIYHKNDYRKYAVTAKS